MATFTQDDKDIIQLEQSLWNAASILEDALECNCGSWSIVVERLHRELLEIAKDVREYNDQFLEE